MKVRWMVAMGCIALLACGDDSDGEDDEGGDVGKASGALCDMTLTYEKDVKPITDQYCVTCHSTALQGAARHDAPSDHNFDTAAGIIAEKKHVDEEAGSGPNSTNTGMPEPGYPAPSVEQRATLAKWLACQN